MKRGVLALALVACSAGAEPRTTASVSTVGTASASPSGTDTPRIEGAFAPSVPLPSLDTVASRTAALAPGMREVARFELSGATADTSRSLVTADASDTCVRVAIVSEPTVHARLVDSRSGDVLAETTGTDAALGDKGPACLRRGGAIVLHVDAQTTWTARVVVWASP